MAITGCRILITDDDDNFLSAISELLERAGHDVEKASSGEEALKKLAGGLEAELALLDIKMPGMDGIETLEKITRHHPRLPVIMLTGEDSVDLVVRAMKAGANNYLPKTSGGGDLLTAIDQALQECRPPALSPDEKMLEKIGIVGRSPALKSALADAANCARSVISVLVTGETGVGKDLMARAIHEMSPRSGKSFVPLDVPNIPANMFESELFGHTKGAFTGATENKDGMVQAADKGTLFLDEIGEFPIELQAKFLRVLDTGSVRKLGSTKAVDVDVRIVSATNRDLLDDVQERKFREDLFYRLRGIEIHIAPLRERVEDIRPLAEHFLQESVRRNQLDPKRFSDAAIDFLESQRWPGNIRELKRSVEAASILTQGDEIDHSDLARVVDHPTRGSSNGSRGTVARDYGDIQEAANQAKKEELTKVLKRNGWNITKAAADLEIDRSTLSKQMKGLGISKPK